VQGAPRVNNDDASLPKERVRYRYQVQDGASGQSLPGIDRAALVSWYQRNRQRSRALFDLLTDESAYYSQPIALRHPLVFYEGHLPAFSFNALVKTALAGASIDPALEALFARGIDPSVAHASAPGPDRNRELWPSRAVVQQFAEEADARVLDALAHAEIDRPEHPLLDRAEAAFTILEHEAMHQETLLYMFHRLPPMQKRRPADYQPRIEGPVRQREWIEVAPGEATLGVNRASAPFAWDNECPSCSEQVAGFSIERHNVTNAAFLEFIAGGGYQDARWWNPDDWQWVRQERVEHPLFWERHEGRWYWRGMFELIPLPLAWPVYVSHAEADAYARWQGARLPTEAEFQRAAYGAPAGDERPFTWGATAPTRRHGVFDFVRWDPAPAGSHPDGRSAWGIEDLVGNGWEWTSTVFGPFSGFQPMAAYPQYSADFFDNDHFVMKGASPVTARELLRPTFRNWFRPQYPYVYATFRCVRDLP
jgi:iron(II)-dependent oxidoreductase